MAFKSLKEARLAAMADGELPQSTQFPIYLNGTTIYMQPEKMDSRGGFPVLNAEKYIREHHPDKLQEFQQLAQQKQAQLNRLDEAIRDHCGGERYPFRSQKKWM